MKNLLSNIFSNFKKNIKFNGHHNNQNEFKKTVCYSEKDFFDNNISSKGILNSKFYSHNNDFTKKLTKISIDEAFIFHNFILDHKIKNKMGLCTIDNNTKTIYDLFDNQFSEIFSKLDRNNLNKLKYNLEFINSQTMNKNPKIKLELLKSYLQASKLVESTDTKYIDVDKDYLEIVMHNYIYLEI